MQNTEIFSLVILGYGAIIEVISYKKMYLD